MTFRPLKAPSKPLTEEQQRNVKLPALLSPKLDGLRVLVRSGAVSSSLKPVNNNHTRGLLSIPELEGLDGEVSVGDGMDPEGFKSAISAVMRGAGKFNITYWVFDLHDRPTIPYEQRYKELIELVEKVNLPYVKVVPHTIVYTYEEMKAFEYKMIELGFEGAMIRSLDGLYKYNRSTINEGYSLKLKSGTFKRGDAVIIGFKERLHNTNEAFTNERGLTERSKSKEGLIGRGDLGSFYVRDLDTGIEFSVGMGDGLDDKLRKEVWENQEEYLGEVLRYTHMDYGGYDKPRIPKFECIRPKDDLGVEYD